MVYLGTTEVGQYSIVHYITLPTQVRVLLIACDVSCATSVVYTERERESMICVWEG